MERERERETETETETDRPVGGQLINLAMRREHHDTNISIA
jgi:hypothetical protein